MKQILTNICFFIVVIAGYHYCLAQDDMCDRLISCISINGDNAIKELESNLELAEIPFLKKKDALFTHFIWLKEYDSIVYILRKKSYGKDALSRANLFLDIGEYERGIELIYDEVNKGNSDAYVALAMEYRRGRAVPIDLKKAFEFYKMAKEKGNLDGFFYLGRCYEMGIGVTEDCTKAVALFQKAAEHGHQLALYRLSEYYKSGACGVPKDLQKANSLMQKLQIRE